MKNTNMNAVFSNCCQTCGCPTEGTHCAAHKPVKKPEFDGHMKRFSVDGRNIYLNGKLLAVKETADIARLHARMLQRKAAGYNLHCYNKGLR